MLTKIWKRSAPLLALAVVCGTVALVPQTAGAVATIVPNAGTLTDPHTAPADAEIMKACPGDSASAAGFTDTTSTDVDCIKMFGITQGKTATTYDPTGTISRQDMARFIHRMFVPTGVAAAGTTAVPAFTDIAHVDAGGTAAISALASHGITLGTTATTFSPDSNVTRAQMASFLSRFADIAKDHQAAATAIASTKTTGTFNYTDITGTTYEEMESIVRLYNLGVHGTCVVTAAGGGCPTTYRPADDITRAEMASMLVNLLNHTNARPAGVTIQSTTANLTVGTVSTLISSRNADFSAEPNVLVDEFYQLHNDAAGVAAQTPFHAILGTCLSTVTKTLGGTLCVIDANDPSTNAKGNVAGTNQTTAAYKTGNWWVHTGASGSQYIDGTTADTDKLSVSFGAASALVAGNRTTYSSDAGYALAIDRSAASAIANDDGIGTYAGGSRTFTATMANTGALTSTVMPGYTFKVVTDMQDHLGNVTVSTAYYATTDGVASWTVTCPADNSALNFDYWVAFEQTVTLGTVLGGTGIPSGGGNPLASVVYGTGVGGDASKLGVSCDDTTRAYTGGTTAETLSVSSNNYTTSTAGSLASITSTAYDQYGAGVAGATSRFTSVRTTQGVAGTSAATAATVNVATLTSGANGTSSLSAVVCATGERDVAWSITDPGAATSEMDAITATVPNALAVEGTTIYCSSAGADGVYQQTTNVAAAIEFTFGANIELQDSGSLAVTYAGATVTQTSSAAGQVTGASIQALLRTHAAIGAVTCAEGAGTNVVYLCTWPAGMGVLSGAITATSSLADADSTNATLTSLTSDGTGNSVVGVSAYTFDFIDDDATANTIITKKVTTEANASGASTATTTYQTWTYDSTDTFSLDAGGDDVATTVAGASEAQFETENASLTALTTDMTINYRTGALTTGISYFVTGT